MTAPATHLPHKNVTAAGDGAVVQRDAVVGDAADVAVALRVLQATS